MTFIQFQTRVLNIFSLSLPPLTHVKRSYEVKLPAIILHFTIQKGSWKTNSEYSFKTTFSGQKFQKCLFEKSKLVLKQQIL